MFCVIHPQGVGEHKHPLDFATFDLHLGPAGLNERSSAAPGQQLAGAAPQAR